MIWLFFMYMQTLQEKQFPDQKDIHLSIYQQENYRGNLFLLAPHGTESVANEYVIKKVLETGGCFIVLKQANQRNIDLHIEGETLKVDPNRIFTPLGVEATLKKQNPGLSPNDPVYAKAKMLALKLGEFITSHMNNLAAGTIIIAIHNNTHGYDDDGKNGMGSISMHRYQTKFEQGAKYIKDLYYNEKWDEDDLFFVTWQKDFDAMKKAGFNVLLQHPQVASLPDEDDGSLSVLSEMKGLRYINVEAERARGDHGSDHLKEQKAMVDFVFRLVNE